MKAYVLHQVGDLRYEDVPVPECLPGWALIKVKAAGICSSDIPRIFTKGTYHFPTIPGHEFSGIVVKVGDEKNSDLIGKHVGVFPLIPCRTCDQCHNKHYEMCRHYDYIGSRRDGAYAEYVAVPIWNLIPISKSILFEEAALLEPLSVALHAIKMGQINEDTCVAIIGTGMIGIAAGLWAKKMNAKRVVVIGRNESKRKLVEQAGLLYDTKLENEYDFVLEAVGSPDSITSSINLARAGGHLIFMGNPSGNIELKQDVYWKILRKQLHISGTWNSSYDGANMSDWTEAIKSLELGSINIKSLISHSYSQEDLKLGLELMSQHKESYCKIMTYWNE